jgi:hypothetical protein
MDSIRDFPDGPRTAAILALFRLAWKPQDTNRLPLLREARIRIFLGRRNARRLMQGFVFGPFRQGVIDTRIVPRRCRHSRQRRWRRSSCRSLRSRPETAQNADGAGDLASSAYPNQAGALWCLQAADICRRTRRLPLWPATCGGCHLPRVPRLAAPQSSHE